MRTFLEIWDKRVSSGGHVISNLRNVDDTTLLAILQIETDQFLRLLESSSCNLGLTINKHKTKMIYFYLFCKTNNRPDLREISKCKVVQSYLDLPGIHNHKYW